jgi:hypothetical protein
LVSSLLSAFGWHVTGVGLNWMAAPFEQTAHYAWAQLEAQAGSNQGAAD